MGGATQSAAHTLLFNVFLFFCVPGDSLNQCAQTFLPPVRGIFKSERMLKNRIVITGNVIGLGNVVLALLLVFGFPQILTTSGPVTSAVQSCGSLLCLVLFLHPCGISTEGILMATKEFDYLLGTYIMNMLAMLAMVKIIGATGSNLYKVWTSLVLMQVLRLMANMCKLLPQQLRKVPAQPTTVTDG